MPRALSAVLISGESGTGKSLFARAIHNNSSRKKRPLIVIDCAAVPDSLQEIELFGCEKGAMPGIMRTRQGKMEQRMLKLVLTRYGETLEGKKKAAQALNISLATLYNKYNKLKKI